MQILGLSREILRPSRAVAPLAEVRRGYRAAFDDADLGGIRDLGWFDRHLRIQRRGTARANAGKEVAIHRDFRRLSPLRNLLGLRLRSAANRERIPVQLDRAFLADD